MLTYTKVTQNSQKLCTPTLDISKVYPPKLKYISLHTSDTTMTKVCMPIPWYMLQLSKVYFSVKSAESMYIPHNDHRHILNSI